MAFVVFVPGIMGSELRTNDTGAKKWPVLTGHKVRELSLDITPEILEATPILSAGYPVYNGIISQLEKAVGKNNVIGFGYDWRQDLQTEDTFKRLYSVLENKDDIIIVAHSMGGLLTKLFIHWCVEQGYHKFVQRVKKVITIATPWRGAPDALIKLLYGMPHPRSTVPLTPASYMKEVATSLNSVYQLLPHIRHLREDVGLVYDPKLQRELRVDEVFEVLEPKQKEKYQSLNLTHFQDLIAREWPGEIDTYAIIGHGEATINYIFSAIRDEAGYKMIKERHEMAGGDNTVPVSYAMPYDERTKCRYIKATHRNIVRKDAVYNWIISILNNQPDKYLEQFDVLPSKHFPGKIIRVACPVEITIHKDDLFIGGEANDLLELHEQLKWLLMNESDNEETSLDEEVFVVGDSTYIVSKENEDIELKIVGKKEGIASVEVKSYENGEAKEISSYPALQVKEGTISTIRVTTDNEVSLTTGVENLKVEPIVVSVHTDRSNVRPKTHVTYILEHGNEVKVSGNIIIQSPIKFTVNVSDIEQHEYLETRMIANGKDFVFEGKELIYLPEPGLNEIKIYSVSVYGAIDLEPFSFRFIFDSQPPITEANLILFPSRMQLFLKGIDDSKVRCKTYYKKSGEEQFQQYTDSGLSLNYNEGNIEYYSVDIVDKPETPKKVLRLPTEVLQREVFINRLNTFNELIALLRLEEGSFSIKAGAKDIINFENKIPKKTKNILISTAKGINYSIVFNDEFEILWTLHPKEKIKFDDEESEQFKFQLISSNGFVTNDALKIKVVPKSRPRDAVQLDFEYLPETMEYMGYFGLPKIPGNAKEGSLQILVGNKVYREAKFRVL